MYGSLCYWCREEVATCIDHYVPYSWDQDNSIENLVPSLTLCNVLARSKLFESVDHKRQYILNKRRNKKHGFLRYSEYLVPFVQHEHSPSPFLCAYCYDEEYGTQECASKSWIRWLELLDTAEIPHLDIGRLASVVLQVIGANSCSRLLPFLRCENILTTLDQVSIGIINTTGAAS